MDKTTSADGSYGSRKLVYSAGTSLLVFATGILAAFWPTFRPCLETVIGGLIGTLAIYAGANTVTKHVLGRNQAALVAAGSAPDDDDDEAAYEEPLPPHVDKGSSR